MVIIYLWCFASFVSAWSIWCNKQHKMLQLSDAVSISSYAARTSIFIESTWMSSKAKHHEFKSNSMRILNHNIILHSALYWWLVIIEWKVIFSAFWTQWTWNVLKSYESNTNGQSFWTAFNSMVGYGFTSICQTV